MPFAFELLCQFSHCGGLSNAVDSGNEQNKRIFVLGLFVFLENIYHNLFQLVLCVGAIADKLLVNSVSKLVQNSLGSFRPDVAG